MPGDSHSYRIEDEGVVMEAEERCREMNNFLRNWENGIYEPYLEACRESHKLATAWEAEDEWLYTVRPKDVNHESVKTKRRELLNPPPKDPLEELEGIATYLRDGAEGYKSLEGVGRVKAYNNIIYEIRRLRGKK